MAIARRRGSDDMKRWRLLDLLLCSVLWLAACGQVEALRSPRLVQAAEFNQRAQHAFRHGEYEQAATLYERALQVDMAIEHADGIAINTLNLARVNQVRGQPALAEHLLDRLLDDQALHFAPAYLTEAAVQKSLLRLRAEDAAAASIWLDRAVSWCNPDCKLNGVIANVRAGIALQGQDGAQALSWSERAAAENRDVPLEYANALRLQASARMLQKAPDAALPLAEEALRIDKALGLPEKIRQDLLLLAQVQERRGQPELAAQYRERAARIAAIGLK